MKKYILTLLCSATCAQASVSITSAGVVDMRDGGGAVIPVGSKFIVVVSTTDSVFTTISSADTLSEGSFIAGGDDYILKTGTTVNFGGQAGAQADKANFNLDNGMTAGDQFRLYWFPTLTGADTSVAAGAAYGDAFAANWALPTNGNAIDATNVAGSPLNANNTVAASAVPEPTSTALLGLGSAAMLLRRRRK